MPTKRGSKPGQLEDQIKRIARRLLDHRRKHNASRSRDDQSAAVMLIQFQQRQDRMAVQHELERLDRYQASASQLQTEAARRLRRRRATTKTSTTPDGKTRIEFRPAPPKFQPADYIWRLSGQMLQHILTARWKLQRRH